MVFTAFPSKGAHRHHARADPLKGQHVEATKSSARPDEGVVRILRSPEELAEAVSRAQEFERRNAEVMTNRAQRYLDVLADPKHSSDPPAP
jgi:hypothetical protein